MKEGKKETVRTFVEGTTVVRTLKTSYNAEEKAKGNTFETEVTFDFSGVPEETVLNAAASSFGIDWQRAQRALPTPEAFNNVMGSPVVVNVAELGVREKATPEAKILKAAASAGMSKEELIAFLTAQL